MKSILSIQSNVLCGKVGNAISRDIYAQFPVECTFIDTVYFSGVASQKTFGVVFESEAWLDFIEKSLLLLHDKLEVVHTGYFGSAKQMQAVGKGLSQLVKPLVVVDPVMGDNGKIYVKDCVVQQYQKFLQYATVITPNFFELEVLCQQKINNLEELFSNCQSLMARFDNLQFIVVTSVRFANLQNNIVIVTKEQMHHIEKKLIYEATFGGCGDVFTSLLCCYYCSKPDVVWAASQAIDYLYAVIELCVQNCCGHLDVKQTLPSHIKALSISR